MRYVRSSRGNSFLSVERGIPIEIWDDSFRWYSPSESFLYVVFGGMRS